jgi:hypothetical protein
MDLEWPKGKSGSALYRRKVPRLRAVRALAGVRKIIGI